MNAWLTPSATDRTARRPINRLRSACNAVQFEQLETRRLMSADGGGPEPIEPDFYEPNNSFAGAANLGTTNTVDIGGLTIHLASDVDYFKFTAASSATVGVRIDFSHLQGNLQLAGYNSAQQLIASSNTSTPGNGVESIALNLTAGQLYYLKVSGSGAGTVSPDYSLTTQALVVSFDWTMPARFGAQQDQWGLPIIPNTHDYVWPNPVHIGTSEYPQFGVRLDGSATYLAAPSTSYDWHITGLLGQDIITSTPVLNTDLPQGQYTVKLTATGSNGVQLTTTKSITVKDRVIVAMGDSYGSGEGNPHQPQQFDIFGFPTSGAKWAQGLDDTITATHRRAHRSSYAGVVQAAVDLENADPKSSVTFLFLDHTGATIQSLVSGTQPSGEPGDPVSDPSQINQLRALMQGGRHVNELILSIGGNDAGFTQIAQSLLQLEPGSPNYQAALNGLWADAATRRNTLFTQGLPNLLWELDHSGVQIEQIALAEYPDPTHDGTGGTAQQILHDIFDGLEIDQNELDGVRTNVMAPLSQAMAKFARENQWEYITDIASAFNFHGYGDWFRTATDSAILQGPVGNRFTISPQERAGTTGTLHPTAAGQQVYRNRINAALTQPNLVTQYFALTPGAFLAGATDGFQLRVKNISLTGSAGPSAVRICISPDNVVNLNDTHALEVPIPALAPGQDYYVTGVLPWWSDPYRTNMNIDYVAPVLDVRDEVAESVESDNLPIGSNEIASIRPERDLIWTPLGLVFDGPQATPGTMNAKLGLDEFIGAYDIDGYSFAAQAGQRLSFDIDSVSPTNLDTYLRIYRLIGNVIEEVPLASNDNRRAPDEPQVQTGESFLEHTFSEAGSYVAVVSHTVNAIAYPMALWGRQVGEQGSYSLTIAPADIAPPVVSSAVFDWGGTRQKLKLTFNENVSQSLSASDLILKNLTTNQQVPSGSISLSYDLPTNTATFTFASILADGNYRATLPAGSISDLSGNVFASDFNFNFFALAGDANHDGRVNVNDFTILAGNFNQSNRIFSQGDFNYDGVVNTNDFTILASRFGTVLAPDGSIQNTGEQPPTLRSPFGTSAIASHDRQDDALVSTVGI